MSNLQERTRWEPAEAEAPIFERWRESVPFTPEPDSSVSRQSRGEAGAHHVDPPHAVAASARSVGSV